MQTCSFSQSFLRQAALKAKLAQTPTESLTNVLHAAIVKGAALPPLENISIILVFRSGPPLGTSKIFLVQGTESELMAMNETAYEVEKDL